MTHVTPLSSQELRWQGVQRWPTYWLISCWYKKKSLDTWISALLLQWAATCHHLAYNTVANYSYNEGFGDKSIFSQPLMNHLMTSEKRVGDMSVYLSVCNSWMTAVGWCAVRCYFDSKNLKSSFRYREIHLDAFLSFSLSWGQGAEIESSLPT